MRSDSELQHDIQEELENETDINVEQLDVQVYKGAATLTGKVATEREKWKADDALRRNPDVTSLVNDLEVVGKHAATVTTPTRFASRSVKHMHSIFAHPSVGPLPSLDSVLELLQPKPDRARDALILSAALPPKQKTFESCRVQVLSDEEFALALRTYHASRPEDAWAGLGNEEARHRAAATNKSSKGGSQ